MSKYPLYERFSQKLKKKDIPVKAKKEFIEYVKSIDSDASEKIYVLIRCYQQDKGVIINMKHNENKLEMNFDTFPHELKQVLHNFMIEDKKKIEEEKNRVLVN